MVSQAVQTVLISREVGDQVYMVPERVRTCPRVQRGAFSCAMFR